jgi:hypothetical protein
MKIAGQRTGETYPEAQRPSASGGALAIGEVMNSAGMLTIPGGAGFVDLGVEIDFVAWTPGDVLTVEYWCTGTQNPELATNVIYSVIPLFDVGAGFAQLDPSGFLGLSTLNDGSGFMIAFPLPGSVSVACPVAPKVKLQGGSAAGDILVPDRSCLLRATRYPASLFVTSPAGILPP